MADIEHRDIPEEGLHEPKGASTASEGHVYVSNGAGSGEWKIPNADPTSNVIERLLDGISAAASQEPVGLDTPLQMEFGAAQGTISDPVMLSAAGALTINEAGTYRIKISLAYGRTGGAGVSELYFRALVNGTQAGQSIHAKVGSSDVFIPYTDEAWLTLPAGTVITYEMIRDSSGTDSGGIFAGVPITAGWNDNPCAALRVERFIAG